jgi:hypothetical protein
MPPRAMVSGCGASKSGHETAGPDVNTILYQPIKSGTRHASFAHARHVVAALATSICIRFRQSVLWMLSGFFKIK